MGNPVVHFELIGPDPARLRAFYSALLGRDAPAGAPVAPAISASSIPSQTVLAFFDIRLELRERLRELRVRSVQIASRRPRTRSGREQIERGENDDRQGQSPTGYQHNHQATCSHEESFPDSETTVCQASHE